jgi:hypothetical protein
MSTSSLPTEPVAVLDSAADVVVAAGRRAEQNGAAGRSAEENGAAGPGPDEEPPGDGRRDPAVAVLWRVVRLVLEAAAGSASAVDGALSGGRPTRSAAVDLMIGGGAVAGEVIGRVADRLTVAGRSIGAGVSRLPLIEGRLGRPRALSLLAERGRRERAAATADLERLIEALVPAVTSAVLDRLDLTALVRDRVALDLLVARVDIDAVAARLDVDAVARRIDLDAIVDRLDLVSLTNRAIDGIDLPEIIRESTGSISGGMVRGVRMQSVHADQAVNGLVSRLFRRQPPDPEADTTVVGPPATAWREMPS